MDVKNKKEDKLLERLVVTAETEANVPPSRESAKQSIAASMKVDQKLVVIKKITPVFGARKVHIVAHIYKTEEKLKQVETSAILNKGKKKGADKKEGEEATE